MNNYNTTIEKYQGKLPKNKYYKFIKIIKGHNVIDVVRMTRKPKCHIKKLTKKFYVYTQTGEVKEIMPKKAEQQFRNVRSLKKIFADLRQLIETNFQGGESEKFLTLTYRDQHNDPKKIYKDLELFNKKLKRVYPDIGYLHIVEPHASGNFHVHSLLKHVNGEPLNMTHQNAYKLWGQGYATVEALNNVDNIGAYFIAYFSNLEIDEKDIDKYEKEGDVKEVKRQDGNGTKKVIKGKRLDFYPDYMKIYRNSKNLQKPQIIKAIDEDFKKTYEVAYKISTTDEKGNTAETFVKKEQYKRPRRIIIPKP